jgi:hypothetical protein
MLGCRLAARPVFVGMGRADKGCCWFPAGCTLQRHPCDTCVYTRNSSSSGSSNTANSSSVADAGGSATAGSCLSPLGGVFQVELLSLPPPPKTGKGWTIRQVRRRTLQCSGATSGRATCLKQQGAFCTAAGLYSCRLRMHKHRVLWVKHQCRAAYHTMHVLVSACE